MVLHRFNPFMPGLNPEKYSLDLKLHIIFIKGELQIEFS